MARPIVVVDKARELAPSVAPGLSRIGVVLPYAPVHHLLFHAAAGRPTGRAWRDAPQDFALVATSANPSGEPLIVDDDEAREKLKGIADLVVGHDRAILARADDSVMTMIAGAPAFLRRARGFVPEPIELGGDGPDVLALGAHLKTTVTVTRGREAFVSTHIGGLTDRATIAFHEETALRMLDILDVRPDIVACDLHPDLVTTRMAEARGLPVFRAQHHAAHIAAIAAEYKIDGPLLGAALDGHGHGDDGGAWGGELMLIDRGSLAPGRAFGAAASAGRRPRRARALAHGRRGSRAAWTRGRGAKPLSAIQHRGGCRAPRRRARRRANHEPWPPIRRGGGDLGRAAGAAIRGTGGDGARGVVRGAARAGGRLLDRERHARSRSAVSARCWTQKLSPREGAELFHGTLIEALAAWIGGAARRLGQTRVALGGGCLMNAALADGLSRRLREQGIEPVLARKIPCNDGGLSLGQAFLARAASA